MQSKSPSKGPRDPWSALGVETSLARILSLRNYKVPTPIQRISIPAIIEAPPRDILVMARTGSGKTLAYLVPLLQHLRSTSSSHIGVRALILCPTRELAAQILRMGKDLARGLKSPSEQAIRWAMLVGGDGMEAQFERMVASPDIVIATPGRFLHLAIEMGLDLRAIDLVIYDEADRLFEMGFSQQLQEILARLPSKRQNLLFSATLPASVTEFSRAGLVNPRFIKIDGDYKISPDLALGFLSIKPAERDGALLLLLQALLGIEPHVTMAPSSRQAIIFVATKHHVEYLGTLLRTAGFLTSNIYGSLDQHARLRQLAAFRARESQLLIVTDVAARGLDIPVMDNVINYNFPASSRLFVHRVGRTARAGRSGSAWSLITRDDLPYVFDLQNLLGSPITSHPIFGTVPQAPLDDKIEHVTGALHESAHDLPTLRSVMLRGEAMFERSRQKASDPSYRSAKHFTKEVGDHLCVHPAFANHDFGHSVDTLARDQWLNAIDAFRPAGTVLEIGAGSDVTGRQIMEERRARLRRAQTSVKRGRHLEKSSASENQLMEVSSPPSRRSTGFQDPDFYASHEPSAAVTGNGYSMRRDEGFTSAIQSAALDIQADDTASTRVQKASQLRWDKRKKRFVQGQSDAKVDAVRMIKGESGVSLPATYQSGRFARWKSGKGRLVGAHAPVDTEGSAGELHRANTSHARKRTGALKAELRNANDIRKQRSVKAQKQVRNARGRRKGKSRA